MGKLTLNSKLRAESPMTLRYNLCCVLAIGGVFTTILLKSWALSPKTCCGGFHAQQAPNTNIVTRPQVTLSAWKSWHGVPPAHPEQPECQQCIELLPVEPAALLLLNPLFPNCAHLFVPVYVYSLVPLSGFL